MTEPVAYWHIPQIENEEIFVDFNPSENSNFEDIPLYTSEDLHPLVKMTKEEFDEFEMARNEYENPSVFLYYSASLDSDRKKFKKLFSWIYKNEHGKDLECELLFHKLWVDYELEKRGGAVKIVPNMKWFVISKEKENGHYQVLAKSRVSDMPRYTQFKSYAMKFDTKEEAEEWTNPLTEAVQLPVEGE